MPIRLWVRGAVLLLAATAQASPFAYVPGSGGASAVTVIDTATDTVVTTVPVGSFARGVAVRPDGFRVFVENLNSGDVSVLDTLTNTVAATIALPPAPFSFPYTAAVNPAGTRLYVANDAVGRMGVVNAATNAFITDIVDPSIDAPQGAVVTPDGSKLYVTNAFGGAIVVIDTATNAVLTSIPVFDSSRGIDVHPSGSYVYATTDFFGVNVIDTTTDTIATSIPFSFPSAVRVHPDGTRLYIAGYGSLAMVDTTTYAVLVPVLTPSNHFGLDINPAGTKVYVTTLSPDQVEVYDATTLAPITTIPIVGEPYAVGRFIGPAFACGNGTHEPGEECDDGNLADGDCCSSTCTLETCNDGNVCTVDSCVAPTGCVFAPRASCKTAEKSILLIKDESDDSKDKLLWKWIKGESTDVAEFGEPAATTDYALCLFAGTAETLIEEASVLPDDTKWTAAGTKGYKYKDGAGAADGIDKMLLKSSDQNTAKALVKGKGPNLPDPPALDTLAPPILVQLINDETSTCWKSEFQPSQIIKQDPGQLKAKAQ